MNLKTSFNILGIGPETSETQAKYAYKANVRRWHPDQFPEGSSAKAAAEEQLKQINIAYARVKRHLATPPPGPTVTNAVTPPHPDPNGTDRHDRPGGKSQKRSWFDHLFDALNAYAENRAGEPAAALDDETDTSRRKTFEQILNEMAGGGIPSKLRHQSRRFAATGRNGTSGYRRYGRNGKTVGMVGNSEPPGPVKPVGRIRGIGRRR